MVLKVVVDVQPPGFMQGVEWVGELKMLHKVVVDIQPSGFVQGVERAGELEMLHEVVVNVQPPGFMQGVEWAGESETLRKVVVNVQPPGFVQGVEWAGESETLRKVVVDIQPPGLVLSIEGGPCWQHPHRPSQCLLVEHVFTACDDEGPTPVLACKLKISSVNRYGQRTRSTIRECQQPNRPWGHLQTA